MRAELRWRLPGSATAAQVGTESLRLAREVFGPVVGEDLTAHAAEVPRGGRCGEYGQKVRLVASARERHLMGILGES